MTALVWELLGAANVAALLRAYRPTFCRMLLEEFGPHAPRAACRAVGSGSAPACAHPSIAATQPAAPHSHPARQAPNVKETQR